MTSKSQRKSWNGCRAVVNGVKCERKCCSTSDGRVFKHCSYHACRAETDPPSPSSNGSGSKAELCQGVSVPGHRYCAEHSCVYRAGDGVPCTAPRQSGSIFCDHHNDTVCHFDGPPICPEMRQGCGKYCVAHTCSFRACYELATLNLRCAAHQPCQFGGPSHLAEPGLIYCTSHRCQAPGRCKEKIMVNGIKQSTFCCEHTCARQHCTEGVKKRQSKYCVRHECIEATCEERAEHEGGGGCPRHACRVEGAVCPRLKQRDHPQYACSRRFCEEHECRGHGCGNQSVIKHGFCADHACKWEHSPCLEATVKYDRGLRAASDAQGGDARWTKMPPYCALHLSEWKDRGILNERENLRRSQDTLQRRAYFLEDKEKQLRDLENELRRKEDSVSARESEVADRESAVADRESAAGETYPTAGNTNRHHYPRRGYY